MEQTMDFNGYNAYSQFMATIGNKVPNQDVSFHVARAAVPYTNNPNRASSTFVRNIRYLPNAGTAFVRLGNNQYWYGMTPRLLSQWLTSNSLGRFYNNYIRL